MKETLRGNFCSALHACGNVFAGLMGRGEAGEEPREECSGLEGEEQWAGREELEEASPRGPLGKVLG